MMNTYDWWVAKLRAIRHLFFGAGTPAFRPGVKRLPP